MSKFVLKSLVFRAKQLRNAAKRLAASFKINPPLEHSFTVTNTGADSDESLGPSLSRLDLHIRSSVLDRMIKAHSRASSSLCPELKDVGNY